MNFRCVCMRLQSRTRSVAREAVEILAVTSAPCASPQREARGSRRADDCDFKKILELACTFLAVGSMRRTSSDLIETATDATHLPLRGDLEDFDRAGQLIDQQIFTVSRHAIGEPLIRTGAAVSFAFNPPVGSRATDVDRGTTRIVSLTIDIGG